MSISPTFSENCQSTCVAAETSLTFDQWSRFDSWIHCIAVVTFDIELGQALEHCFPPHVSLSDDEKSNICYLSFPDSNSGCMGDTQYCFRIKKASKLGLNSTYVIQSKKCPPRFLKDTSYLYGFVYFRQVSDKTIKRGYYQKSVVLLSTLPYFTFFTNILEVIAHNYFKDGASKIEEACHDINKWMSVICGRVLYLPLFDVNFSVYIPSLINNREVKPADDNHLELKAVLRPNFSLLNEMDIFQNLHDLLHHSQLLWELVLLGEPIAVFAPRPTICSSVVLSLISLINPLRYRHDYRPYFTIHDSDFKQFISKDSDVPNAILGVTNPFFVKALQHWPNIIKVGHFESNGRRLSLNTSNNSVKTQSDSYKPGLYSKYKPFLKKDNKFLKTLMKNLMASNKEQQEVLKRYFSELTQSFIIPLERYVASLMPLLKSISPLKAAPTLRPFNIDDFMESVRANGPRLTCGVRGDWVGLYRHFLFTDNFEDWFRRRRREMRAKVTSLHLTALSDSDLSGWCSNKSEVEIVDMVLRIRKKINVVEERKLDLPQATITRLKAQIGVITEGLPQDLQDILKSKVSS